MYFTYDIWKLVYKACVTLTFDRYQVFKTLFQLKEQTNVNVLLKKNALGKLQMLLVNCVCNKNLPSCFCTEGLMLIREP